jgi:hypothetical protein
MLFLFLTQAQNDGGGSLGGWVRPYQLKSRFMTPLRSGEKRGKYSLFTSPTLVPSFFSSSLLLFFSSSLSLPSLHSINSLMTYIEWNE